MPSFVVLMVGFPEYCNPSLNLSPQHFQYCTVQYVCLSERGLSNRENGTRDPSKINARGVKRERLKDRVQWALTVKTKNKSSVGQL